MDDRTALIDLQFDLTLQDMRHILRTGIGIGHRLQDVMLKLALPVAVLSTLLFLELDRRLSLVSIVPFFFFGLGIPLLLEFGARGLTRALHTQHAQHVRFRASEADGIELSYGDKCNRHPWQQIKNVRWTPEVVVITVQDAETIHLPRRILTETQAWILRRQVRRNLDGGDQMLRRKHWLGLLMFAIGALVMMWMNQWPWTSPW